MHKIRTYLSVILICIMMVSLCACSGNDSQNAPQDTTFTIQYSDDSGIHSLTVESGKLYSVESTPERIGYDFLGYYDAKVGGTQYIDETGSSVSPFTDNKNIVLYAQFKAKEYTLILDYQGADITGSRSMKVSYDSIINELPLNLTLEHKNFVGWYTQPDSQGKQISDKFGVLPENQKVTEKVFDLTDEDGYIRLYAGFQYEKYTVTFYVDDSSAPEEIQVEYGTPITDVQPQKRVNGMAVLSWSKKRNDTNGDDLFSGKVMGDMVLYAAEYAPIIDFETNGGNSINSMIVRAGEPIDLPTPQKENYKFIGWIDSIGNIVNYSNMPNSSIKLFAKWQAMIIFDSNGGIDVKDISEPQGVNIVLPKTEKEGYIFAGWYTEDKKKYSSSTMPNESVCLKAGWYKNEIKVFNLVDEYNHFVESQSPAIKEDSYGSFDVYNAYYRQIKISDLGIDTPTNITIKFYVQLRVRFEGSSGVAINVYSQKTASQAFLLNKHEMEVVSTTRREFSWETTVSASGDLYCCFYRTAASQCLISNFRCEVFYPNYNELYL